MFSTRANQPFVWATFIVFVTILLWMIMISTPTVQGATDATWNYDLTGNANTSSPTLADVDGDTFLDIVVATDQGHVTVLRRDGSLIWDRDISAAVGQPANSLLIPSTPAVADIDGDGNAEVVVGTGDYRTNCKNDGSLVVLSHTGAIEPGWPVMVPPWINLCAVFSSPALADLDNDGDMEIVAASFNKQLLAYHHNGQPVAGFPPDSPLVGRFFWTELQGRFADTIWPSPAVVDLDRDNDMEIVITSAEGNFGNQYGGGTIDWYCPFITLTDQYCGGSMFVFGHTGEVIREPIKYVWEGVQSSPAVADVNQDGVMDVVFGSGTFYDTLNAASGGIDYENRLYVINSQTGDYLPGWNDVSNADPRIEDWGGGKVVDSATPASPAVGDIAGDDGLEIIAVTLNGTLYAWFANGSLVPGFPMTPLSSTGDGTAGGFNVGSGLILADTDGDSKMEILLNKTGDVVIVDGDGSQLSSRGNNNPIYHVFWTMGNIPAVGDLDKDGELELVAAAQGVYVWDLPGSSTEADWPMFKQNAAGTGALQNEFAALTSSSDSVITLKDNGDGEPIDRVIRLENNGTLRYDWSATSVPAGVTVNPSSGSVNAGQQADIVVTIDSNANINDDFTITATDSEGATAVNSPTVIQVRQIVVDQIYLVYIPLTTRE